jgi:hypothetical protein
MSSDPATSDAEAKILDAQDVKKGGKTPSRLAPASEDAGGHTLPF